MRRRDGFSLIEMLSVLTIMSITFVLAGPQLNRMIESVTFERRIDDLIHDLKSRRLKSFLSGDVVAFDPGVGRSDLPELAQLTREGWRIDGDPTYVNEQGLCIGGELRLEAPSGRRASLRLINAACDWTRA